MAIAPARERSYWAEQWLPYGAVMLINIAAVLSAWPLYLQASFPYLALALIVFGTPASMYLRAAGVNRRLLNISIVGVSLAFIFMMLTRMGLPGGESLLSVALVMDDRIAVGFVVQMFITVAMFRSFSLLTDSDLTLSIVPAVSTILLSAIIVRGAWIMVALLVFFLGALYLLAFHHQEVVARHAESGRLLARARRRSLLAGATAAMWLLLVPIIFATAIVFSFINLPRALLLHYGQYTEDIFTRRLLQWVAPAWIAPGGEMQLRSGISQRSNILFKVDSTESALWRASTMDTYTGQGWRDSRIGRHLEPLLRQGDSWLAPEKDPGAVAGVPTTNLRQTFQLSVPMSVIVVAAYEPHTLTGPFVRPRESDSSVITNQSAFRPGAVYAVVSRRKDAPGTESYRKGVALSPEDLKRYLAPPDVPARTRRRALEITAKERDPVHKALALRAYLESKFVYRERVTPPPHDVDATDYFLFHMDGAYCDYFASAMAVMARLNGIPSRVVSGFSSDEEEEKTGLWVVREKHAHSWVEVFIDNYGWFELDPSPQPGRRTALIERVQSGLRNALRAVKSAALAPVRALTATPGWWWKLPVALMALAGVALGVRYLLRDKPPPLPRNGDGEQLRQYVRRCYERMCRWLTAWGLPKSRGATATEYSAGLAQALGVQAAPMRDVIEAYLSVEYGGQRIDVSAARALARRLEDVLAVRRRLAHSQSEPLQEKPAQ